MVEPSVPASTPAGSAPVVVGSTELVLDTETLERLPFASRRVEVVCASGHRYEAEWTGVTVETLVDAVHPPADTTHLIVESTDGYRMAVPVAAGLVGVLAFQKDGVPIGETNPYPNRFVSPAIEGERDVKGVARIEFHALAPGSDPDAMERVEPTDDRFAPISGGDGAGSSVASSGSPDQTQ